MILINKRFAEIAVCTPGSNQSTCNQVMTLTFVITCLGKDESSVYSDEKQGEFTHPVVTFL